MGSQEAYGPVCDQPVERPVMVQSWDTLTFIHWRYPVGDVQRLLPAGLEVDPFDGSAWVGLVPFFLRVGVPGVSSVPWMSRFPETNVRTYVRAADGRRGLWFFSLDAARLGAVVVARSTYRLPYFWSKMRLTQKGRRVEYRCRRRWPGPRGAASVAVVDVGDAFEPDVLGEVDHFLTARWVVYSNPASGLHCADAFHQPWPLFRAELVHLADDLVPAAGLPAPGHDPLVHYSPSVEVDIGWLRPVRR
jgi:uncharacterized protein YqjF (DUF2071 family)